MPSAVSGGARSTSHSASDEDNITDRGRHVNIRYSADEDDVVPEGYSSMDDCANRLKTEREQAQERR